MKTGPKAASQAAADFRFVRRARADRGARRRPGLPRSGSFGLGGAIAALLLVACANPITYFFSGGGGGGSSGGTGGSNGSTPTAEGTPVKVGTGSGSISGQVVLADTQDASGVTVALAGAGGVRASETTAAAGVFQFMSVAPGSYTLTLSRSDYQTASQAVQLGDSGLALAPISLASPLVALTLAPASSSVFLPPDDLGSIPLMPFTVALIAQATKQDGASLPIPSASLSYAVSSPSQASVDGSSGVLTVLAGASPGSLTIIATLADPALSAEATVSVVDPQAEANIRILALDPAQARFVCARSGSRPGGLR